VVTEAVPILNQIISIVHWRKIWSFLAEVSEANPAPTGALKAKRRTNVECE